jgi:hypothetical protein
MKSVTLASITAGGLSIGIGALLGVSTLVAFGIILIALAAGCRYIKGA